MGIFSNILGGDTTPTKLNQHEAFLGILLSAVASDGHISDEEIVDFNSIANKAKTMQEISTQQFNSIIDKLFKILRRDGVEKIIDLSVESLPQNKRIGTFAVACDLLFSDGSIEKEEEQILELLKSKLQIEDGLAYKIVEVISVKNAV